MLISIQCINYRNSLLIRDQQTLHLGLSAKELGIIWKSLIRDTQLNDVYTGCFTTLGITAGGDFLGLCDQKSSYKHVSDFGRLRSYDRLNLGIEVNDY